MSKGQLVFKDVKVDTYTLQEFSNNNNVTIHNCKVLSYNYEVKEHPIKEGIYNLRIELYSGVNEFPRRKENKFETIVYVISFNVKLENTNEDAIHEKIMSFLVFNNQLSKDELDKMFYKFEKKIFYTDDSNDIVEYFGTL